LDRRPPRVRRDGQGDAPATAGDPVTNEPNAPTGHTARPVPDEPNEPDEGESVFERVDREGAVAPDVLAGVAARAGEDDDIAPITRPPPRALGIVLALAAAALLVAACFSHRWLANKHLGDFGYSPLAFQQCGARCEVISNFQVAE